jgi:hypothetical protein
VPAIGQSAILLEKLNMPEQYLLQSLFSNLLTGTETWIAVAYLAGMFLVVGFRPQQIAEPFMFRLSYILFALYIVVPSCINGVVWLTMQAGAGGMGRPGDQALGTAVLQLSGVIGRILLGVSIVCGLDSLRPRPASRLPPAS